MAERYIEIEEGDRVIIYAVPQESPEAPPLPPDQTSDDLDVLLEIPPVTIYARPDGTYVHWLSDLDVCSDGSGSSHGDKYHQSMTAYCSGGKTGSKYMNADVDPYIVVPPQIRSMVPPIVMGCFGRVTNMQTGKVYDGVVGDIGPESKTGECAICLAQLLNSTVTVNSGDSDRVYLYEIWPGKVATVNGFTYKLQPA
jgi:hypothetical protein